MIDSNRQDLHKNTRDRLDQWLADTFALYNAVEVNRIDTLEDTLTILLEKFAALVEAHLRLTNEETRALARKPQDPPSLGDAT